MEGASRHQAYLLLGAVVVLWGINWPIMKVGLEFIPPLWFATARALMGSACLFALLAVQGRVRVPSRRDMPVVVSIAVFQIALALALIHFGLRFVDAGRSAILVYTFPLWVVPLAFFILDERLSKAKTAGLALGIGGVAFMFNPQAFDVTDPDSLLGNGILILAALNFAVAVVHIRAHKWNATPLDLMPWQLLLGGGLLAAMALAFEPSPAITWNGTLALVLAYNGPVASAFCFWGYVTVARTLPATSTSLGSLGVPVAGVLSSVWWLGDPLGMAKGAGLILISLGVALVTVADVRRR